jgi:hypothetical protein
MERAWKRKWWLYILVASLRCEFRLEPFGSSLLPKGAVALWRFFFYNLLWRKPISLFACIVRLSVVYIHFIFILWSGVRYFNMYCYMLNRTSSKLFECICFLFLKGIWYSVVL